MKNILILSALIATGCASQDPCVHLREWNYTEEWLFNGENRFQVYKTWYGRKFVYVLNSDSTNFRRQYLKIEKIIDEKREVN